MQLLLQILVQASGRIFKKVLSPNFASSDIAKSNNLKL